MKNIINFLKGIVIGCGLIAPGVSGSVLAIVMGVYDEIIFAVNNLFKDLKKNIMFLLPILIGLIVGVIGFSKILLFFLNKFKAPTMYIFMALIVGCFPKLYKEMKLKTKKDVMWLPFIITLAISIILIIVEKNYVTISQVIDENNIPYLYLFVCGILYGVGKIMPGLSSSALLILMGMYEYFLYIIGNVGTLSAFEIKTMIPFVLGLVISLIVLVKVMNYLLTKHYRISMSIILSLVISSLVILFPGIGLSLEYIISVILFIIVTFIIVKVS